MAVSPQLAPRPATATAPQAKPVAVPDYIAIAAKADATAIAAAQNVEVYKYTFTGNANKEERIAQIVAYLTRGISDSTVKPEDWTRFGVELNSLNAAIQVLRRQLGADQAKEITSKIYADVQRITNTTSADVATVEEKLTPFYRLAELLSKYGAEGNLIVKINRAKAEKLDRDRRLAIWTEDHNNEISEFRRSIMELQTAIAASKRQLESAWFGKNAIIASITNGERDLELRQQELAVALAKTPDISVEPIKDADSDEVIREDILELQNIGGEPFRNEMNNMRDHIEMTLAKMSVNFDEAITGLTNARESFLTMDRNCTEATFALSILEVAVQQAEAIAREAASKIASQPTTGTGAMADLDRMEQENRSQQILGYCEMLTTFLKNVGVGVASLRGGQTVIKSVLRMNKMALESCHTQKITGMANTSDAVTITIGSIIEVCNRAAGQILADGLTRIRQVAEEGNARLTGGTQQALEQQNVQIGEFITSLQHLKTMTKTISTDSIEMLAKQSELIRQMRDESSQLGEATTDAERATFAARAGVTVKKEDAPPVEPVRAFSMRMGG